MCIYFIAALALFFIAKHSCTKIAAFDYKRLQSWSKEVWYWLCRGKDVFGCAVVIVAFVAICWTLGWNNKVFTALGCVLELAGMAQAIISLFDVREYFNRPRMAHICKQWIKDQPKLRRSPKITTGSGDVFSGMDISATAVVIHGWIDTNKPIDEIIKMLAENTKVFSELAEKKSS